MQVLTGSNEGDIRDIHRPIIAGAVDIDFVHRIQAHHHPRGQLLYSTCGSLVVRVNKSNWLITPDQAVWIPPGRDHQIETRSAVSYRSVYVDESLCRSLSHMTVPVSLTPLLKALINTASEYRAHYSANSAEYRLAQVIKDQMERLDASVLSLPMPSDKRLLRVVSGLMEHSSELLTRQQWGNKVGASERTLARLFIKETGLSFVQWRQRYLVNQAVQMLANGISVTQAAMQLGYSSTSAFSAMFRRITQHTPKQYMHLNHGGQTSPGS